MMTVPGLILGTAAYMAPEQARGKSVDQRADIWAFGCVLFEMLAGQRPFAGDDITDVLARVIEREPDWTLLPPATPPALSRLLQKCLRKDASRRFHHIADVRVELDDAVSEPPVPATKVVPAARHPAWIHALGYAAAALLGAASAVMPWRDPAVTPARPLRVRTALTTGAAGLIQPMVSVSPDGRWLAYRAAEPTGTFIRLRDLSTGLERTIERRMEGIGRPVWARDSRSLLLSAVGAAIQVDVETLAAREVPLPKTFGATPPRPAWLDEARLLVSDRGRPSVWSVGAVSTDPLPVADGELRWLPLPLPDGRRYFFLKGASGDAEYELCAGTIDGAESTCLLRVLAYAYGGGRALLAVVGGNRLVGHAVDVQTATLVGPTIEIEPAFPVTVAAPEVGLSTASVSADGLAVFMDSVSARDYDLAWYDRRGIRQSQTLPAGPGLGIDLSADRRFGVTTVTGVGPTLGTYVLDFARGLRTRLTTTASTDAVIAPDGRQVAYVLERQRLVVQGAFGGETRTVFANDAGEGSLFLEHWTNDGQYLIAGRSLSSDRAVYRVPVSGDGAPTMLASNIPLIDEMRLSPDGRWLAFNASIAGRDEVYVSPVPATGERIQLSAAGGTAARWRDDGAELYYLATDGTLMAVPTPTRDGRLDPGAPTALFKTGIVPTYNQDHYAVGADGKSFLLRLPVASNESPMVTLLANWLPR